MNDSIGEKPASEEPFKDSESWFRYAIEATSDGLYDMDVVKGTARCNSRYYTMLGYELYELPPSTETWLSLMHPDDKDCALLKLTEQISQKYEYLENEYRLKHKDGSWVWILDRSKIVEYDEAGKTLRIIGTHIDITKNKKAEEVHRKELLFTDTVIENVAEGICVCHNTVEFPYVKFTVWNNRMTEITGYTMDYINHNGWYQTLYPDPELQSKAIERMKNMRQGDDISREEWLITRADKAQRLLSISTSLINSEDGTAHVLGLMQDITERRQFEEKIKSLLAEKELILHEVHHRLKNNMNTVKSLLSLQAMSLKDPLAVSSLQDTISRVDSMVVLYDKLYCSANFREISLLVYLPPLIDEIVSNFPGSESVVIVKEIDDFVIDLKLLQPLGIIINELLTNTMKYAFTGRDNNLISVSATLTGKRVSIVISDNGNGIPESVTFENSTGFGMQLVSMLTQQIGGTIRIERERERERTAQGSFWNSICIEFPLTD
jgi:PAS domain S-box-containing protein